MPVYDAICSICAAPFKSAVPPAMGIMCAWCDLTDKDLIRHPFFMQLEAFFREKFGQEVRIFQVIKSEAGYNLFIQLKDRKAPLVCRMNLSVAGRDTIKSQPILVLAKTGDNELRTFLEEFIEKRQDKRFRMGLN